MNTISVIKQEPNLEVELWNSITKIVKLKDDIPELDVTKALELIESEIKRVKEKGEIILNTPFTEREFVENKSRQSQELTPRLEVEEDMRSTFEESKTNKMREKLNERYDNAKIGEHVKGRHANSKFDDNPWGIKINVWALCEQCGVMSIQSLAVHLDSDGNRTHVYKSFEHPNEKKKSHWVPVEEFKGKVKYKQILKQKRKSPTSSFKDVIRK